MIPHFPERFVHYRLGIDEIDAEHFAVISGLHELAYDLNLNYTDVSIQMTRLFNMWVNHCVSEELMLSKLGYRFNEYHKLDHIKINAKFKDSIYISTSYTLKELVNCLLTHIDHHDRQYSSFVEKGNIP